MKVSMVRARFHAEALVEFALLAGMALGLMSVGGLISLVLQDFVRGAY